MQPLVPDSVHSLYQCQLFSPYSERLIYGFTGKPRSYGGPDTPDNPRQEILENRRALLEALGISAEEWLIPQQVHGHRVGRTGDKDFLKTDAIVLMEPGRPVMLLYADCTPVMLYDPDKHVGAVIHAGWRGTLQGIVQEAVLMLQNACGSKPENILAVIGPAITFCCFQVSMEVAESIGESISLTLEEMTQKELVAWDEGYPENPRVNLKAVNEAQLKVAGVEKIEVLAHCTRCNDEDLYSFRRGENGRNSAYMMLKP